MKTIREWANELPYEFKVSILNQSSYLELKFDSLYAAINGFKAWGDTYEGYEFWFHFLSDLQEKGETAHYCDYLTHESDKDAIRKMQGWDKEEKDIINPQPHYDNSNGSLYKVATERGWNAYLFDIVKRLERSEKKGEFKEDLEKSIDVIKIWLSEKGEQ